MIACNRRPHCYAALLLQMSAFLLGPCLLNVHWAPLLCCIAPSGDHISAPAVSAQRRHGCFNRTTTGHTVMTGCHSRPHCYAALLLSKFLLPPLLNVDSAASRLSMTGCSLTVRRSKALVHNKAADHDRTASWPAGVCWRGLHKYAAIPWSYRSSQGSTLRPRLAACSMT